MQGLAVVDGDLVLSGGDFLTFTGALRIRQDLTFALKDLYGSDINHPYWGSILNQFIGQPISSGVQQQVLNEIQRILSNYISIQANQVNAAVTSNTTSTFDTSDVVQSVTSIDTNISLNTMVITVVLQTMSGESVSISRTVSI